MPEGSTRSSRPIAGPVLLAVIFLAILGAGAGFSLGILAKDHHAAPSPAADQTDNPTPDSTGARTGPGAGNGSGGGNGNGSGGGPRCPDVTEQAAVAKQSSGGLVAVLHLNTDKSEVWICKDSSAHLWYQGRKADHDLQAATSDFSLFLDKVQVEGGGYVAENTDPRGQVTRYHVTKQHLVIDFSGYQNPKPAQTENAVS